MRIGVDLDGVGFNFHRSLQRYYDSVGLDYDVIGTKTYEFYDELGIPFEEYLEHCRLAADQGFLFCGDTRPGTKEALDKIKGLGHTIHIATDRRFGTTPSVSHGHTSRWLEENDLPYDSLTFSADKTVLRVDMFVEDKLENYDALDQSGVDAWLINRRWNLRDDTRQRVENILEFADVVEKETNNGQMRLTFP
jgi:hypothetical protein